MKLEDTCFLEGRLWQTKTALLKSKGITLLKNVCIVKAIVFPVVMNGCESWTIKKAEHWRINAFKLWCWRRLLRVPWTARMSNQSILREVNPEYSLVRLMLKMKLQYFGHLIWIANSLEKTLMLVKGEERDTGWDGWIDELGKTPGVGDGQGGLACCKESDVT